MMRRLPTVEEACSSLHQSESHIEVLKPVKEVESLVMFIKGEASCIACGKVGHTKGNYWFVVGFPPKGQKDQRGKGKDYSNAKSQKWHRGGKSGRGRMVANAHNVSEVGSSAITARGAITPQQFKQLMKLLPTPSRDGGSKTEDEMDFTYAGMVSCCYADTLNTPWIIDSGAPSPRQGVEMY